jgi:hypothetical protein
MDELYRRMTPRQKLERVRDLSLAANQFALAGLRMRHPGESENLLALRLARMRLGPQLFDEAYPGAIRSDEP